MFDPGNRRYRYAFTNCTDCGPRYTITHRLPYDRSMTSMAAFAQCAPCLGEYRSPLDRRFHAEPNACAACGPRLDFLDASGRRVAQVDPIAETLARIARGDIVAIKGLGGFHLACDARNAEAVARLRARKAREEKPFAVMVANVASARHWVGHDAAGRGDARVAGTRHRAAAQARRLRRRASRALRPDLRGSASCSPTRRSTTCCSTRPPDARTAPPGSINAQELVLVMTSANPGGEPLVTGNDEAFARLAGIADAFLVHDRDIVVGCDDSVLRAVPGTATAFQFVRRARGYTPRAIRLARAGPPVLALGGYFKNTVCVTRGDEAFVSQHIGDLDNAPTCEALDAAVAHLVSILEVEPQVVAHDLHPDFYSSRHAARLAAQWGIPTRRRPAPPRAHRGRRRRAPDCRVRCSGWRSMAWAWGRTAAPGAASCSTSTARIANGWAGCGRCACPAAIAPRGSRGAWARPRCRSRAATTRSPMRFAD